MKMPLSQHHRKVPGSLPLEQLWDSHPEPAATIWRMWCSDWSDLDHLITLTPLSGAAHWQQVGCLAVGSCLFFVIPCWQNPPRVLIIKFCCCLVIKSCLTLCDPMDGSPPVSSAHGISQARILEWVAISFSKGSSQPRNRTRVSCLADGFFTSEPSGKPLNTIETGKIGEGGKVKNLKEHFVSFSLFPFLCPRSCHLQMGGDPEV